MFPEGAHLQDALRRPRVFRQNRSRKNDTRPNMAKVGEGDLHIDRAASRKE